MRHCILFVALMTSLNCFSQFNEDTICKKRRPLPVRDTGIPTEIYDTINISQFQMIVDSIYMGALNHTLTLPRERGLIKIMNTISWASLDGQNNLLKMFPRLIAIEKLFNSFYSRALYCKYTVGIGKGFSYYYKELDIYYLGTPDVCNRFYVTTGN